MNIVDEEQRRAIQSYEPHAPVTRRGVLRSLVTGQPIAIPEEDMVIIKIQTIEDKIAPLMNSTNHNKKNVFAINL